jgi:Domain of unknown function (DUF4166)
LLQSLHRSGGRLQGEVQVRTGHGLAGVVGKRLAARLGMPAAGRHPFTVDISHRDGALVWLRRFGDGHEMISIFRPQGSWPDGCWIEQTGPLQLRLGVDIRGGGWQWQLRSAHWRGLRLPPGLLPQSQAGKRIVDGRYAFDVRFSLPLLGTLLAYGGVLDAQ